MKHIKLYEQFLAEARSFYDNYPTPFNRNKFTAKDIDNEFSDIPLDKEDLDSIIKGIDKHSEDFYGTINYYGSKDWGGNYDDLLQKVDLLHDLKKSSDAYERSAAIVSFIKRVNEMDKDLLIKILKTK